MGKTAGRLRELHPSRHHETELGLADVMTLLERHFGAGRPHVQHDDVSRLIMAIALARSDEARCGEGHVSRKRSVASLRAMLRLADDDLTAALKNCDITTFGRVQDAQFILSCSELSERGPEDDHKGLRRAIKVALDRATGGDPDLAGGELDEELKGALSAAEAHRSHQAGNKEKPHLIELATACTAFWKTYGQKDRQSAYKAADEKHVPPKVKFTTDVFLLAGIARGFSRIADLLDPEAKSSN